MGASQRRKGAQFEREIAADFAAAAGYEVKRHLGQARDGGEDIVVGTAFVVECKRRKSLKTLMGWFRQCFTAAVRHAGNLIPLVVLREDNGAPMVLLTLDDFLILTSGYMQARPSVYPQ